ncbi:MAG: ROK family protein [Clostridiales bacterium]|nr:ROK family protein [Clostridiales bacterium]
MSTRGMNSDFQKRSNRGLALRLVATGECRSRIELSRRMDLTKTTISVIVSELLEKGYLTETLRQTTGEPGPNPVGLAIGSGAPRYAGVLIQRGYAEAAVCDLTMKMMKYERMERDWQSNEELMEAVFRLLDHMLDSEERIAGIGVSSIGPVDVRTGRILRPLYFGEIGDIDVTDQIRERYGLPVYFDHDNQGAALVEYLFGGGKGFQDILMIGVGRGVGCGIITRGRRVHSSTGYTPEIGHMSIDGHGRKCICGNVGCLETYIMEHVVEEAVEKATGRAMDYREICLAVDDPAVDAVMREMIENLSTAVVSLLNILNFEVVLLNLNALFWPERYVALLEERINAQKFSRWEAHTRVRKASFGDKTQVLGAVCNAVYRCFEGDLPEENR